MYEPHPAPSTSPFLAVPMDYALAQISNAKWEKGPHAGLQSRDLLLSTASHGQMDARHFRASLPGKAAAWAGFGDVTFRFFYVLKGELTLTLAGGKTITLGPGDSAYQDILEQPGEVRWTADFEAMEITAPPASAGDHPEPVDLLAFPPRTPAPLEAQLSSVVRDIPENYKIDGLRKFMSYRDLGTTEATGRRIHIHLVAAVDVMPGGTGWHVHSMSQIFYVTRGWVDIAVDGQGMTRMVAGDAMCLMAGMRHDVARFSPDYATVEMCLPADYSTVATPAPKDAAA